MAELKLEDLTKEELIELFRVQFLQPSASSIREARRNVLIVKAKKLSKEALAEQKIAMAMVDPRENLAAFLAASDKFDRAMRLHDEIDKLFAHELPKGESHA